MTTESSGSAGAAGTRRRRRRRGTGDEAVEHGRELVGALLPVEVARDDVETVRNEAGRERVVFEQPLHRVGHRARVARRHDQRGLAIDRVLAAPAVVGGDERRAARERLETRLAEAFEPAPDREHARGGVLLAELTLLEVLARVTCHRNAEQRAGREDRVGALPRALLLAAAEQRVLLRTWVRPEHLAVHAAELHRRAVTGGGGDLVGGPVAVRELQVDGRVHALPAAFFVVERAVVERVEARAAAPVRSGRGDATAARG